MDSALGKQQGGKQQVKTRTRSVVVVGLSIAFLAVSAWVTIPLGPIPFTLQILALTFVLFALSPAQAVAAICGYVLLGALGVPVFSSFRGGLAAILGPTGGFIVGYAVAGCIAVGVGVLARKIPFFSSDTTQKFLGATFKAGNLRRNFLIGIVFLVIVYLMGWAWLMVMSGISPEAAFAAAVAPFVVLDLCKMLAALLLAQAVGRAFPQN